MNEITTTSNQGFMIVNTLADALKVADIIAKSSFCPKAFAGKSGDVLVAIQWGQEIGLKPLQALQNIAVINGRPSLWGDAMLAVCRQASNFEYVDESFDKPTMTATCKAKRRNEPEVVRTFSKDDAIKAGLWGKNVWASYPERMLSARARGFCLRDAFADTLRGIISAEEASDYPKQEHKHRATVVDIKQPETILLDNTVPDKHYECISVEELDTLVAKMKEAGSDVGEVCKHLKIASLHFVPKAKLAKMLERLEDKIASKNAPHGTPPEPEMHPEVAEFLKRSPNDHIRPAN